MVFSAVTSMGTAGLLAASGTTANRLYIGAVDQLRALSVVQADATVTELAPPMDDLTRALVDMHMPREVVEAAMSIRDAVLEAKELDPHLSVPLSGFLHSLHVGELLPDEAEDPHRAIDRLLKKTQGWMPAWKQARSSTMLGFGVVRFRDAVRFRPTRNAAPIEPAGSPRDTEVNAQPTIEATTKVPVVAAPEIAETAVIPSVIIAPQDTSEEPTRKNPLPFHISGQSEVRFELTGILGEGGGGVVYEAHDLDLDRYVALKLITKPGPQAGQYMEYFRNEARLQGKSSHRRIVTVHEVGKSDNGEPFIIMEMMNGSLMEKIEAIEDGEAEFKLSEIMEYAVQATAAVAEAHSLDIIHKDIKPENFFMNATDTDGVLKLGDFGIAQTLQQISSQEEKFVQGTPSYMPMEAWHGADPDAYTRDVYALGVLLFEMLTGKLPYDHEKSHIGQYIDKRQIDPPKPSQVAGQAPTSRQIPPELDRIVLKALARNPKERYPNAEALLVDLSTYRARIHENAASTAEQQYRTVLKSANPNLDNAHDFKRAWQSRQESALAEYKIAYKSYPLPSIADKIYDILLDLILWADVRGYEGQRKALIAEMEVYAPDSKQLNILKTRVSAQLDFDGAQDDDDRFVVSIGSYEDAGGVLKWNGYHNTTRGVTRSLLKFSRGNPHYVMVDHPEYHPVGIPMPTRPASTPHTLRVPLYLRSSLPDGGVIISAGPVPIREYPGRFSEKIAKEDLRIVPYDYWMGPKLTNRNYIRYLIASRKQIEKIRKRSKREQMLQAFATSIPQHWHPDVHKALIEADFSTPLILVDLNGRPLIDNAAVTGVTYRNAVHCLKYTYREWIQKYGYTVLPSDLNEWRRAWRGNDRRSYTGGDATRRGNYEWRFSGFKRPARIPTNDFSGQDGIPSLDYSPFSIMGETGPVQAVRWLVSGTRTLLRVADSETANLLLEYSGREYDRTQNPFDHWSFTVGAAYDSPVPKDVDIVRPDKVENTSVLERVGIFPVIKLRTAEQGAVPTPMVSTLIQ